MCPGFAAAARWKLISLSPCAPQRLCRSIGRGAPVAEELLKVLYAAPAEFEGAAGSAPREA